MAAYLISSQKKRFFGIGVTLEVRDLEEDLRGLPADAVRAIADAVKKKEQ